MKRIYRLNYIPIILYILILLGVSYMGVHALIYGPDFEPSGMHASARMARFIGQSDIATYTFIIFGLALFSVMLTLPVLLLYRNDPAFYIDEKGIYFGLFTRKKISFDEMESYEVIRTPFMFIYFNIKGGNNKRSFRSPRITPAIVWGSKKNNIT